jgi:Domain of Unknown Function (DUF1080)
MLFVKVKRSTMRHIGIVLFAILAIASPGRAQKLSPEEKNEGFVSLFNGQDFSGWRLSDNSAKADNWKVQDGVIKLSGGSKPHLGSQWEFDDFDVRFEWRAMVAKGYNSGFYVRSGRAVGTNQINLAQGTEGGFIGGKIKGAKTVPELQKKPMEWNDWRVVGKGDKLTFWCNGKLAWEGTELPQKRGYFGLQAEGAPIEFRNIRIKELGYDSVLNNLGANDAGLKIEDDTAVVSMGMKSYTLIPDVTGDFTFRTEWKCDKGANAQIYFNSGSMPIGDLKNGSGGYAGKIKKNADYPVGDWNYLEIKFAKGKASVWLNGNLVNEDVDIGPCKTVTFTVVSGTVQLRAPRVRFAN